MLFDTRNPQSNEGFKPNVDNTIKKPEPTGFEKFLFVLFFFLTLGFFLIGYYVRKNYLLRKINEIQEASSLIQAAEKKRRATLIKQLDAVKGYAKFENSTLTEVTRMRSKLVELENENNVTELKAQLDSIQRNINLQFEAYPDLKASQLFLQFNTEIALQEDEIYSTIRIYNMKVNSFNSQIYTFWTNCVAKKIGAYNQPLFSASEQERQDVDTSSLSEMKF
ncbi:LemA family protein [Mycoplasma phocoeninasale]|uniref:LemA family protein n=1 Tax=Mycoplasma phocoeninasale TaxID=2726117 RepID=A0A858U6A8_9MOLU|nr:LemA family protein [Mycoplasma phocoeninasale]MBN0970562.1 LemA family protein [Mycoplasma phocoeninasale]QJG66318.1 LemA family protein [Mycoplasma phocoeninasale]